MIYELGNNNIDLDKLENISKISYHIIQETMFYYFEYQLNGIKYKYSNMYDIKVKKERKKLLEKWEIQNYYQSLEIT